MSLTDELVTIARSAGAASVGVARAGPFAEALQILTANSENGLAGPLGFTYDDPATSTDIRRSLPWARSLLVFGISYVDQAPPPAERGPVIGRFATRDNYEPVRKVATAVTALLTSEGARAEILIDDSRLVDRSAAVRAGVGWLGRSTMVLAPGHGPWMLLGTVATDADLEPTEPMKRDCGTCTACMPACPTGAISDGALDARRCLSTWLQTAGSIPMWVRPILGRRIYGCDDCLTSCPPGQPALRASTAEPSAISFTDLLACDDDTLVGRFSWWFVPRRDGRYIRRNLVVAGGNSGEPDVLPALGDHLRHPSSMIRGHAAWAVARLGQPGAAVEIRRALSAETAPEAREEMLLALMMLERPLLYSDMLALDESVSTDQATLGLALSGVDLAAGELPRQGMQLVVIGQSGPPDMEVEEVAGLIRVNDRSRVIERMRRRARREMTRT